MASPTVSARSQGNSGNATSHPATLPTHTTGDLIVTTWAFDANPTISVNTGVSGSNWTLETPVSHSTNTPKLCIVWKVAESASEALTLTTGTSEASAHMCWAIDAGASPALEFAYAENSSANPDPPSLTPTTGSQDYLFLTGFARDNQATASAGPSGWDQFRTEAGVSSGGAAMAVAELAVTGTSANPGAFTIGVEQFVTFTMSVLDTGGGAAQELLPPLLTRTKTIYAPTVTGGLYTIQPPLLTRTRTIYAPTVVGGEQTRTALSFPSNDETNSDIRLIWANSTGDMPPRTAHMTIHWSKYRQQDGYYANWWTLPNLSSSYVDITGDYFSGYHPYPCDGLVDPDGTPTNPTSSTGTEHFYEIAGLPNRDVIGNADDESLETIKGVWIASAHYTIENGSNTDHIFYPDLFGNPSFFITATQPTADITGDPKITADRALVFGSSTWTVSGSTNDETPSGEFRGFRVYDITTTGAFSVADMQAEAAAAWQGTNAPATSDGTTAVWYINDNPTHTDISDKSGEGHDPVWANAIRPTTVEIQNITAPLLTRTKTIYAPTVSQAGGTQTLEPPLLTRTKTIYAPTVSVGAVSLAPPLLTRTKTIYAPTVAAGTVTLQPPLLSRAKTLYVPTVSVGAVALQPPLLTRAKTIYTPVVSQSGDTQIIVPPLLTRAKTIYAPVVTTGEVEIQPPLLTRTKTIYAPTVTSSIALTPSLLTRVKTIYAPTVTPGVVNLVPPLLTRNKIILFPTVTGGDAPEPANGMFWPLVRRRRR